MIYENFLFIHIPKSGGSSMEKMFLGEHRLMDFTIKHIFKDSKFTRWIVGTMRNRGWRVFIFCIVSLFFKDLVSLWGIKNGKVLQHLTYQETLNEKYLTHEKMNEFVKFCIVRNPYDRLISAYHFLGNNMTFSQFVSYAYKELDDYYRKKIEPFVVIKPQIEFVINNEGKNMMSEVLYFENLQDDFEIFCQKYKLEKSKLPHINKRIRDKKNIKEYYDQRLADMVYNIYRLDFKAFGYKKLIFKRKKKIKSEEKKT